MTQTPRIGSGLPAPLRRHKGEPLLVAQLGMLGGRTLLLTDLPALYLHDSAGIFSQERTLRLEPFRLDHDDLVFASGSTSVKGDLRIREAGEIAFEQSVHTAAVAKGLPIEAHRVCPLPISIHVRFTPSSTELLEATQQFDDRDPRARALAEHWEQDELYAHPEVADGRLVLRRKGAVLCDLPVAALHPMRSKKVVTIEAEIRVAGVPAQGLVLHFPVAQQAADFEARLRPHPTAAPPSGTRAIDGVTVRGAVEGVEVRGDADAVLGEDHLALHVKGSGAGREVRFGLGDPTLRITADARSLVVVNDHSGPLVVTGKAVARFTAEPSVQAVIQRTLASDRVPACLAMGEPVVVEQHERGLSVSGFRLSHALAAPDLQSIAVAAVGPGRQRWQLDHRRGSLELVGAPLVLAAIHRQAQQVRFAHQFADRRQALGRAVVAMEGRYLLYTLMGPLVELHGVLRAARGTPGEPNLRAPLALPTGDEAWLALAADLLSGAAECERHLERVATRLPAFLTARDVALLGEGERPPVALKRLERRVRAALMGVRGLAGKLMGVHEPLRQALGPLGVEPDADFSMAALSAVAGALINPVFLVTGASQALAATSQADRVGADRSEHARRIAVRCVERWNHAVLTLVAPTAQQALDDLFAVRWEVAKQLADVPTSRLAGRLARLDAFLKFPASDTVTHSRQAVVDQLEAAIAGVADGNGFHAF